MSVGSNLLQRRPPAPIPILVLTGFLGAGKTTLLNRWVKTPAFSDAAVVINEFGEIGLDHLLVEKAEGTVLTLSSGCLCCTIRGDMIATLEGLIRDRDNGRVTPFARLVIETTGLADPAPILNTILFHPYLPLRYRIDSVVTAVDALHGAEAIAVHDEALRQVVVADTLILTKTELAGADQTLPALRETLHQLNPGARVIDGADAEADLVLAGGVFALEDRPERVRDWIDPSRYEATDHAHDHVHDINRHDARVRATCFVHDGPVDEATLQTFLDLVRSTHGAQLLRAKGIIGLKSQPDRPIVIHGVQHYFHPTKTLSAWPDGDHRTRLVFITRDLKPEVLHKLWSAFFGAPGIDMPDAAGLSALAATPRSGGLFG